jgi:hypothetical protein
MNLIEKLAYVAGRGPKFKVLQKGRVELTPEERALVIKRDARWSAGSRGQRNLAVFKSVVNGKKWYTTHTHRAYNVTKTLKGTISRFHKFIKSTS